MARTKCTHCDKPARVSGVRGRYVGPPLCSTHWDRLTSGIPMDAPTPKATRCAHCDRAAVVSGARYRYTGPPLCNAHYQRHLRGMDLSAPMIPRRKVDKRTAESFFRAAIRYSEAETEDQFRSARRALQSWARAYVLTEAAP